MSPDKCTIRIVLRGRGSRLFLLCVAITLMLSGCGDSKTTTGGNPGIQPAMGPWEFNLKQTPEGGSVLLETVGPTSSAANQTVFVTTCDSGCGIGVLYAPCAGGTEDLSLTGSVTNSNLAANLLIGGQVAFNLTAQVSSTTALSGSYTSAASAPCSSEGTAGSVTGTSAPKLDGTYTGTLASPVTGTYETVTLTASTSGMNLSVALNGSVDGTLNYTGTQIGNLGILNSGEILLWWDAQFSHLNVAGANGVSCTGCISDGSYLGSLKKTN